MRLLVGAAVERGRVLERRKAHVFVGSAARGRGHSLRRHERPKPAETRARRSSEPGVEKKAGTAAGTRSQKRGKTRGACVARLSRLAGIGSIQYEQDASSIGSSHEHREERPPGRWTCLRGWLQGAHFIEMGCTSLHMRRFSAGGVEEGEAAKRAPVCPRRRCSVQ